MTARRPGGSKRGRIVAIGVAAVAALTAAILWSSRGGDGRTSRAPLVPATEAPEPPPRHDPPRTERERLARLVEVLLRGDTDDALWARGKLLASGSEGRELVAQMAASLLESNVAFVEHAFDLLLVAPEESDLPLATAALRSGDPLVVRRACVLLGRLGAVARGAAPDVGRAAITSAHPVPQAACEALAAIGGDAAVEALVAVASSEEAGPSARAHATLALGNVGGPRAVAFLLERWAAATGQDRLFAAEALLVAGDRTPVPALREAWNANRDEPSLMLLALAKDDVAFAAADARLRDPLEPAVRRLAAISLLAPFPAERKLATLRQAARNAQLERDVRVEAWDAVVRAGDASDEADLLRLLRTTGPNAQEDRCVAALVLGRLRRPAHGKALVEAAAQDDSNRETAAKILSALALCGSAEGAAILVNALASDPSSHEDGDSLALQLGAVLDAPSRELREALAPLVLGALRGGARVPGPRARYELLLLAGRVCGSEAAPVFEGLLTDEDRHLRRAAALVLAEVHGPNTERALRAAWWARQDPYTRSAIATTLLRLSLGTPVR